MVEPKVRYGLIRFMDLIERWEGRHLGTHVVEPRYTWVVDSVDPVVYIYTTMVRLHIIHLMFFFFLSMTRCVATEGLVDFV